MQKNKKKRKSLNSMKFAKRAMVDSKERRESQKEFWDEYCHVVEKNHWNGLSLYQKPK